MIAHAFSRIVPALPVLAAGALLSLALPAPGARVGGWTSGAQGTLPDPVFGPGAHVIDLAQVGQYDAGRWAVVLDYQSFTVQAGATVRFANHPTRAMVVIRSLGAVVIDGELVLDGETGNDHDEQPVQAEPGPGGFRGGLGRKIAAHVAAAAGHGPGGGFIETQSASFTGGSASHAFAGGASGGNPAQAGARYGSADFALPLGGSGGAGGARSSLDGAGGGAGGGALLLGSDVAIHLGGTISLRGGAPGESTSFASGGFGGAGSGGALRLVAPLVTQTAGLLDARGGVYADSIIGGSGWIRIESENALDPSQVNAQPAETLSTTLGEFMPAAPPVLRVTHWRPDETSSWTAITPDPQAQTAPGTTPDVALPTSGSFLVRIEGTNVPLGTPLHLRLTNTRGQASVVSTHVVGEVEGSTQRTSWTDVAIDFALGIRTLQVRAELP